MCYIDFGWTRHSVAESSRTNFKLLSYAVALKLFYLILPVKKKTEKKNRLLFHRNCSDVWVKITHVAVLGKIALKVEFHDMSKALIWYKEILYSGNL